MGWSFPGTALLQADYSCPTSSTSLFLGSSASYAQRLCIFPAPLACIPPTPAVPAASCSVRHEPGESHSLGSEPCVVRALGGGGSKVLRGSPVQCITQMPDNDICVRVSPTPHRFDHKSHRTQLLVILWLMTTKGSKEKSAKGKWMEESWRNRAQDFKFLSLWSHAARA